MKLYLDDDSASILLVRLLRTAGHDVQVPADVANSGQEDPIHFAHAILENRVCLTHNHHDFEILHDLVLIARGHHPGILVVRKDNDPKKDLSEGGIVRAIGKLLRAGVPMEDQLYILNHWR